MSLIPHASYGNPFQGVSDFVSGLEGFAYGLIGLALLGGLMILVVLLVVGAGLVIFALWPVIAFLGVFVNGSREKIPLR